MARARFIRPEYFTDEKTGVLSFGARILFPALWCHADLRGVFESGPKQLAALVFPFDDDVDSATVSGWLSELENAGLIRLGVVDGKRYGHVVNFERHQRISTSEEKIGTKRPGPKSLVPGTKVGTEAITRAGTKVGTETASISLSPTPTLTPTPTHTLSPARDESDFFTDTNNSKPEPPSPYPMDLPTRLRDPYHEILDAHGPEVAQKAFDVARKHFPVVTPARLLEVYGHNVQAGTHTLPADRWLDFRQAIKPEAKPTTNLGPSVREWFMGLCQIESCFVKTETILAAFRKFGPEVLIDVAIGIRHTGDGDLNEDAFKTWFQDGYTRKPLPAKLTDPQVLQALGEYGAQVGVAAPEIQSLDALLATYPTLRVDAQDRDAMTNAFETYGWADCANLLAIMEPIAKALPIGNQFIPASQFLRRLQAEYTPDVRA